MVILEIDGQKYAGPTYIDDEMGTLEHFLAVQKLAEELVETTYLHYGYPVGGPNTGENTND